MTGNEEQFVLFSFFHVDLPIATTRVQNWEHSCVFYGVSVLFHRWQRIQVSLCYIIQLLVVDAKAEWPVFLRIKPFGVFMSIWAVSINFLKASAWLRFLQFFLLWVLHGKASNSKDVGKKLPTMCNALPAWLVLSCSPSWSQSLLSSESSCTGTSCISPWSLCLISSRF